MKRVVSVSLGSSKRDKASRVVILGEEFEISRIGTDGNQRRFAEIVRELDGTVDAIGLGGIDRYLYTDNRRYTIEAGERLASNAHVTPVVDGSGIKNTLERRTIEYLQAQGIVDFGKKNVMVVCATDRFGMAQAISKISNRVVYGDLMFNLGLPVPIRSYRTLCFVASVLLPIFVRLPFEWIYPTGKAQEVTLPRHEKYYRWADVIAGDYLLIKRTMPTPQSESLKGKTIVSNTVTEEDVAMLRERGVATLVTGSPQYDGRYYATNVFEGVLIALLGKRPERVTPEEYGDLLKQMNWQPTITTISS